MTEKQQITAAIEFKRRWKDKGSGEEEMKEFWIELLRDVFGVKNVDEHIIFKEIGTLTNNTCYANAYIPSAKVVIAHRTSNLTLDGWYSFLANDVYRRGLPWALEQGLQFSNKLKASEKPRYIIGCNFKEFRIYDLNKEGFEDELNHELIKLSELEKEYYLLYSIVGKDADPIKQLRQERKTYLDNHKRKNTTQDFAWYYISQTIKKWKKEKSIAQNRVVPTLINTTFIEKNRVYDILKCLGKQSMKGIKVPDRCELFKLAAAMDLDKFNRIKLISVMEPDMPYPFNDVEQAWESTLQNILMQADKLATAELKLVSVAESLQDYGPKYRLFKDLKKVNKLAEENISKECNKNDYPGAEY